MALRKRQHASADGVPVELYDLDDPVWQSEAAYETWLTCHKLSRHRKTHGPVSRHHDGACAFAIHAGSYRTYGEASYPWPDLSTLDSLGVPIRSRRPENGSRDRYGR